MAHFYAKTLKKIRATTAYTAPLPSSHGGSGNGRKCCSVNGTGYHLKETIELLSEFSFLKEH